MVGMIFKEAAELMLADMREQERSEGTLRATNSRLSAINKVLGATTLSEIAANGRMVENYLAARGKTRSGSTIHSECKIIRKVIESVKDDKLNCVFPILWNTKALKLPSAKPSKDRIHETAKGVIEKSVAASIAPYSALVAVLGFTGMRVGEAVACRIGTDDPDVTHWDADESLIRVRTAIDVGDEHAAKTEKSADRIVDLCSEANDYLRVYANGRSERFLFMENGKSLTRNRLYRAARKLGLRYHGLRRARVTHLYECARTPADEQIMTFWLGHESEESQTEKYSRLCKNVNKRREFCELAGIGFRLPESVALEQLEAQAVWA